MNQQIPPILGLTTERLHLERTSAKWDHIAADVIPMWVAEMDSTLAEPIAEALHAAVARSDTGYASQGSELADEFADFALRRWGWTVKGPVLPFTDVGAAITETLRRLCQPGDSVIITTPVYPSFFDYIEEVSATAIEVPLLDVPSGGHLDLDGLEKAMRAGGSVLLLSNPHNPTGTVHSRDELKELADCAARHNVRVISDEIHAPLTFAGEKFTPYLDVADDSAIAVHSASKAWNIAGLKCGMAIGAKLPAYGSERAWSVGHFGVIASIAAYRDGEPWLDRLIAELEHNTNITAASLSKHTLAIPYRPGRASYFAWLDCRQLHLKEDPATFFTEKARIKLSNGTPFGRGGNGWVRMNIGTSPAAINEAIERIALAT